MKKKPSKFDDQELMQRFVDAGLDPDVIAMCSPEMLNEFAKLLEPDADDVDMDDDALAKKDPEMLAERRKVAAYAERPEVKHALAAAGRTPKQFVEKFSESRRKDPTLTAQRYGAA